MFAMHFAYTRSGSPEIDGERVATHGGRVHVLLGARAIRFQRVRQPLQTVFARWARVSHQRVRDAEERGLQLGHLHAQLTADQRSDESTRGVKNRK